MKKQTPTLLIRVDVKGLTQAEAEDIGSNVFYSVIGSISYKRDCEYIASGLDVISSWADNETELKPKVTIDIQWRLISSHRAYDIANDIGVWMEKYFHTYIDTCISHEPGNIVITYDNAIPGGGGDEQI